MLSAGIMIPTVAGNQVKSLADAVQSDGDQSVVYVLRKNGPQRRSITTGPRNRGEIEIKRGLTAQDEVLITTALSAPARGKQ